MLHGLFSRTIDTRRTASLGNGPPTRRDRPAKMRILNQNGELRQQSGYEKHDKRDGDDTRRRRRRRRRRRLITVWFVLFYCFFLCFFLLCVFGVRFVSCVCVCLILCSFVLRNFEVHDSANAENPIIKHRGVLWCVLCGCVAFLFCGFVLLLLDLACLMSVFMCLSFFIVCVCLCFRFLPGHHLGAFLCLVLFCVDLVVCGCCL